MNNNINSDVNLASQTHQVPHIGFPQIDPVTKARKVKRAVFPLPIIPTLLEEDRARYFVATPPPPPVLSAVTETPSMMAMGNDV